MKSANWISAMGRRPARASPIPMPTIEDSASGVSMTPSFPHVACRPSVRPRSLAPPGGVLHLGLDLRLELLLPLLGQQALLDEVLPHPHEGVLLAPQLDLRRGAVAAVVVVGGVAQVPVGLALDQGSALA